MWAKGQGDADGAALKEFAGEWMAKPVSGGAMNIGFDRWVALHENQVLKYLTLRTKISNFREGPLPIFAHAHTLPIQRVISDTRVNRMTRTRNISKSMR